MNESETLHAITAVIQDVGIWAVFAWLFVQERRDHKETIRDHIEDLRILAGRNQGIAQPSQVPSPYRDVEIE